MNTQRSREPAATAAKHQALDIRSDYPAKLRGSCRDQRDRRRETAHRFSWFTFLVVLAVALAIGCVSPDPRPPEAEWNPPKGKGIWTLEKGNAVTAINRRQEHFSGDDIVMAIIYGYDEVAVVIELIDLQAGLIERDEHYIPPGHTVYHVYSQLQTGRYKVQMIIEGTLVDQFYFTVDRWRRSPPTLEAK